MNGNIFIKKVTTFQLLLKSRVETHVPIPKIKYVMGVSKLQVSKNDDEEHCFLKEFGFRVHNFYDINVKF